MRRRFFLFGTTLLILLCLLTVQTQTCRAGIILTDLSAVFVNPIGGENMVNEGVGTNFFSTVAPLVAGTDQPNSIFFTPYDDVVFSTSSFFDTTGPLPVGTFTFFNGRTQIATSANTVDYEITGTATLDFTDPELDIPVSSHQSLTFTLMPNIYGDIRDADIWTFPGMANILVPEDEGGVVEAYASLRPINASSPAEYYSLEIVNFVKLEGDVIVEPIAAPIPEPTTVALLGIGLIGLAGGTVRAKWKERVVDKS